MFLKILLLKFRHRWLSPNTTLFLLFKYLWLIPIKILLFLLLQGPLSLVQLENGPKIDFKQHAHEIQCISNDYRGKKHILKRQLFNLQTTLQGKGALNSQGHKASIGSHLQQSQREAQQEILFSTYLKTFFLIYSLKLDYNLVWL